MRLSTGAGSLALLAHTTAAISSTTERTSQASWKWIRKRDSSSNVTVPAAISIAASQYWDGDDGPWSSFPLQIGTGSQIQDVRVMVGTAAYNTWTIGPAGCPTGYVADCDDLRGDIYNPASSATWVPNSNYSVGIESNLNLSTSGVAGFDTVTLGWQGSGGPSVEHSVLFNIYDPAYWLGILGVNPLPTNFTNLNDPQPSIMETLASNDTIPGRSYGYTAGNQYRLNKVFGSLTLGGYDKNRFTGTGAIFDFYEDISRDLLVNIQSITTDSGSPSNLLPGGEIAAFVDSTTPQIWLPESACAAFESAFGLEWDSSTNLYLVNGSLHTTLTERNPNVTITLVGVNSSTVNIVLPYGAFDLNVTEPTVNSSTYYFPLQRASSDTQYTLGRTFFQEAYLIADYDRSNFTIAPCNWNEDDLSSENLISILSPNWTSIVEKEKSNSGGSSFPTGAIAGVVVGIVALIAILCLALFLIRRKKNRTKAARLAELEAKSTQGGDGKTSQDGESKPFISTPMGGELGGEEVHELTAPYKSAAHEMDSPYKTDPNKAGYSEMEGANYFGHGKDGRYEMGGSTPMFELQGSDVHEMPSNQPAQRDEKIR